MLYRGMYHFSVAYEQGLAVDIVKYFSAPENRDLGIVKRARKQKTKLVVSPFPTTQRSPEQFFFQPSGSNFNLSDVTDINLSSYTH
jgi:hypothetical protein